MNPSLSTISLETLFIISYLMIKVSGVKSWGNAGEEEHEHFPTLELILNR